MINRYFDLSKDVRFPINPNKDWEPLDKAKSNDREADNICVYLLKADNRIYVGTGRENKRLGQHKCNLKKNRHPNKRLQKIYDRYGINIFFYQILCLIPKEYINFRNEIENSYIRLFDSHKKGYNICEFADSTSGRKHSKENRAPEYRKMGKSNVPYATM